MEFNLKSPDKKTLRNAGLATLAVGAVAYSAYKLYQYLAARKVGSQEQEPHKAFAPSYRKQHKPHHRHAAAS